jgi:hypothetical protein
MKTFIEISAIFLNVTIAFSILYICIEYGV